MPEKFLGISQRISSLIEANCKLKTSSSTLVILLSGPPGSGKKLFLKHLSSLIHLDVYFCNCFDIWSDAPGTYETNIRNAFEKGFFWQHCQHLWIFNDLFLSLFNLNAISKKKIDLPNFQYLFLNLFCIYNYSFKKYFFIIGSSKRRFTWFRFRWR